MGGGGIVDIKDGFGLETPGENADELIPWHAAVQQLTHRAANHQLTTNVRQANDKQLSS